jgi:hypothetical protein
LYLENLELEIHGDRFKRSRPRPRRGFELAASAFGRSTAAHLALVTSRFQHPGLWLDLLLRGKANGLSVKRIARRLFFDGLDGARDPSNVTRTSKRRAKPTRLLELFEFPISHSRFSSTETGAAGYASRAWEARIEGFIFI